MALWPPASFITKATKSQGWCLFCRAWVTVTVGGMSEVRYWAWDLRVQSPTLQLLLPRWNEEDCPERGLAAPQTPSPAVQLCRCGCRPSLAGGSRRSREVPGDRGENEELKMHVIFHWVSSWKLRGPIDPFHNRKKVYDTDAKSHKTHRVHHHLVLIWPACETCGRSLITPTTAAVQSNYND